MGSVVVSDSRIPAPSVVHKIVPFEALAPETVTVPSEHTVVLPPATAVGKGSTFTVKSAVAFVGEQAFTLLTVIVKVTVLPASSAEAV